MGSAEFLHRMWSPPPLSSYQHRAGLRLHESASGEDRSSFWHLDNSLSPSVSWFIRASIDLTRVSRLERVCYTFYSACVSHHYISLSHGSLRFFKTFLSLTFSLKITFHRLTSQKCSGFYPKHTAVLQLLQVFCSVQTARGGFMVT